MTLNLNLSLMKAESAMMKASCTDEEDDHVPTGLSRTPVALEPHPQRRERPLGGTTQPGSQLNLVLTAWSGYSDNTDWISCPNLPLYQTSAITTSQIGAGERYFITPE